ncbi:MAG: AAA family ATPase [bacterium]
MLREELIKRSPIRIFEKTIHGGIGKGNLGVFTGRKGVGKTACLVHLAVDKLLSEKKVLHISFSEDPHHIEKWYEQTFKEIAKAYKLDNVLHNHDQIISNRLIMNYKPDYNNLKKTIKSINNFLKDADFYPDIIIIDGFSFENASEKNFTLWKEFAKDLKIPLWFSATLHRENLKFDDKGIPAPVNKFQSIFTVIIMLLPQKNHIDLSLLKDHHAKKIDPLQLKLDPETLLIANHRV